MVQVGEGDLKNEGDSWQITGRLGDHFEVLLSASELSPVTCDLLWVHLLITCFKKWITHLGNKSINKLSTYSIYWEQHGLLNNLLSYSWTTCCKQLKTSEYSWTTCCASLHNTLRSVVAYTEYGWTTFSVMMRTYKVWSVQHDEIICMTCWVFSQHDVLLSHLASFFFVFSYLSNTLRLVVQYIDCKLFNILIESDLV